MGIVVVPGDRGDTVYISDTGNARLRAFTGDGSGGYNLRTVAGTGRCCGRTYKDGAASDAEFAFPMGLAAEIHNHGVRIFVADYNNARVRVYDSGTSTVGTVAGSGEWGWNGDGDPSEYL